MKKILLVTLDFWPNKGGVANYYYNLAKNLPISRLSILTCSKKVESDLKIFNHDLLYKYFWPKWLREFFVSIYFAKKEKAEILWAGEILPTGTVLYLINKIFKIPYFVSTHGLDIMNTKKNILKRYLAKKILNNAKFITANSESTKELLSEIIDDKEKIKVTYPGVNLEFRDIDENLKEIIKKEYNLKHKKIILTVGRLVERKNHEEIIKAIKSLKPEIPEILYVIIGSGPNLDHLKSLVKLHNLEENVMFLNNIDNEILPYFYSLCDIFIMTSKTSQDDVEGFGIVYLEAGLFRKPVIASYGGGAKEAVQDKKTGFLVSDNDSEKLEQYIRKLLLDENLAKQLGENAYSRIKEEFLWKDISKKLIKHIEEIN